MKKYERKEEVLELTNMEEFAKEEQVWSVESPRLVRTLQNHPVYAAMDELEKQGYKDNTIIVFTWDDKGLATSGDIQRPI